MKKIIFLLLLLIPFNIYALECEKVEILEGEIIEVSLLKDYVLNVDENCSSDLVWSTESLSTELELKDYYLDKDYSSTKVEDYQKSLRAYKEGTYVVKVENGSGFSDTIKIKAVKKINDIEVYPPSTNFNNSYDGVIIYLSESNKLKLNYYIYPEDVKNKKLIFSSSDESIFTVGEDGNITAKKIGSAKLLVKSDDGNASIEYKVEVKDKLPKITIAPSVQIFSSLDEIALLWDEIDGTSVYNIYRSTSEKGTYNKISETKDFYYYDTKLTYGVTYYYKVEAYNKSGSKTSKIVYEKIKPEKIDEIRYTSISSNKVKLTWDKGLYDGYSIYRSTNKKDYKKIKNINNIKTVKYTDDTVSGGTTYYYKIRVFKLVNNKKVYSDYSNVLKVTTYPSAPKIEVLNLDYNSFKINIKKSKNATKYSIYRSIDNSNFELVKETDKLTFKDKELDFNKKYYYRVKACDKNNNCSDYSKVINNTTKLLKPTIKVKVKSKKVTVTINSINGSDGYEIYRSTKKNKKYKLIKDTKKTSYSEKLKKKTYYYKVRPYKIVDNKKVYGEYSSIKKIKVK